MTAPARNQSSATPPDIRSQQQVARMFARRRRTDTRMTVLLWSAATVAVLPLIAILSHIVSVGISALTPSLFVRTPAPAGVAGGGMANGIAGTLMLVLFASLIGLPVGVGAGLYLAERRGTRLAATTRFVADVLSGLPSIVLGIFVWEVIVRPSGQFSALAGGVALGLVVIPMVTRATEEMVKLVPRVLTESALALGFPRWRASLVVGLRTAMPGIVTAALVAIARAAGETAPLLFTALGNAFWSVDPTRPIAALPLQIFSYAQSPYAELRAQAWAGALVLLLLITLMSVLARSVLRARRLLLHSAVPRAGVDDG